MRRYTIWVDDPDLSDSDVNFLLLDAFGGEGVGWRKVFWRADGPEYVAQLIDFSGGDNQDETP